jgi:hypothetical protein
VVAYFSGLATLRPRADGSQQSVLLAVDSVDAAGDIAEAITSEELHDWLHRAGQGDPGRGRGARDDSRLQTTAPRRAWSRS